MAAGDNDVFYAMQRQLSEARSPDLQSETSIVCYLVVMTVFLPPDWSIDLQRLAQRHCDQGFGDMPDEFTFTVYTWHLDHVSQRICREPKIAVLGDDPSEWEDDLKHPWRHRLLAHEKVFIDLVYPHSPRADIEEHVAHMILTQRLPQDSSVLLSMEFLAETKPNVIVRFAVVVPRVCTPRDVEAAVPLLASFSLNRINWEHPGLQSREQQFSTRHGLGLSVHIIAEADSLPDDGIDSTGLLQSSLSSLLPAVSHLQPATEWFKAHLYLMLFCWYIYNIIQNYIDSFLFFFYT